MFHLTISIISVVSDNFINVSSAIIFQCFICHYFSMFHLTIFINVSDNFINVSSDNFINVSSDNFNNVSSDKFMNQGLLKPQRL
jgi:hypothetical protein